MIMNEMSADHATDDSSASIYAMLYYSYLFYSTII